MLEPLKTLRAIFQAAQDLHTAQDLLDLIANRVQGAMDADVCSVYLLDEDRQELVLAATQGLNPESVGEVRLPVGAGLVGYAAEHRALLNLDNASQNAYFRYFPETREEQFASFLAVPIIGFRRLKGVIVIQKRQAKLFSDEEEAFVITIAAQLAGPLSQWMQQEATASRNNNAPKPVNTRVQGVKGAPGVAIGHVRWVVRSHLLGAVPDQSNEDASRERALIEEAMRIAHQELADSGQRMEGSLPNDVLALFSVYRMILEDPELKTEINQKISEGWTAATALRKTIEAHARIFENMDDSYLQAKAEDVRHIGQRIYNCLRGERNDEWVQLDRPTILFGADLSIGDVTQYSTDMLHGIVCTEGSALSHMAILANAMGIPAVMGAEDIRPLQFENDEAIIDGYRGALIFNPVANLRKEFIKLVRQEAALVKGLDALKDEPAETRDGYRINLYANTGLLADISPGLSRGAEGIGLYRSEIPFMLHESFPSEEEQVKIYQRVLEGYAPRPVHMRTLDIGGDKSLPYFSFTEQNPFLGWRGIRFTLDNTTIFLSQIRAMLRAAKPFGNLKILLPMVSRLDEIHGFHHLLNEAIDQLAEAGNRVPKPAVGAMIEVPSAMILLPEIAKLVDFVSIGSNDFTQYLLAVDRNNPKVASLYSWFHPAVLRSIGNIVKTSRKYDLPVSLCGEMAADPAAAILLLGMGIDMLSLSAYNIPKTKWVVRSFSRSEAQQLWRRAQRMKDEVAIRLMLESELESKGLGGLIRAGA